MRPGRRKVFTSTATTRANGQPTDFGGPPGSPGTLYSLEGFYASGSPARGVILLPTESVSQYLAANPAAAADPGRGGLQRRVQGEV